jgi:hypothetical protein
MATGAPNAANASVGKPMSTGGVYVAFADTFDETKLPTDATTPLDASFQNAGFISEDGVTNSVDMSNDQINAWGGVTVIQTDGTKTETFQNAFIETNLVTLQAIYGKNNVSFDEATKTIKVRHNNNAQPNLVIVFEIALTGNKIKRIVVPNAKLSDLDDVQYTDSDAIAYAGTYTALASPLIDGDTSVEYIAEIA